MKSAIYKTTILTVLLTCTCAAVIFGCRSVKGEIESDSIPDGVVAIPHGYMARLEQVHDGRMIGFGPFVGYYFRPENPRDLSWLSFVCFNEKFVHFHSGYDSTGPVLTGYWIRHVAVTEFKHLPVEERVQRRKTTNR